MARAATNGNDGPVGGDVLRLDAVDGMLGYNLRRAQVVVFQAFTEAFEAKDIRPVQFTLLLLLADNPGAKHVQLAGVLGIRRANMVALVNDLEARGLVRREANPEDRRAHALFLTNNGERFTDELRRLHDDYERRIRDRLGAAEFDKLVSLLGALYVSLPEQEPSV